jgi:hypothetical protein
MYELFMSVYYDKDKYESPGMALKCYLKYEMEKTLLVDF